MYYMHSIAELALRTTISQQRRWQDVTTVLWFNLLRNSWYF